MKVSFRQTTDHLLVAALHKKCFQGEFVRDFSEDVVWLILADNEMAGFCSVSKYDKHDCFLSRCGILLEGFGLQRKAIRHRLAWCRRNNIRTAITYASPDNFKSIANLIRCGLHLYVPEYQYGGKDKLYFRKDFVTKDR